MIALLCFLVGVVVGGEVRECTLVKEFPVKVSVDRLRECDKLMDKFRESFKEPPPRPQPIYGKMPIDRPDVVAYLAYGDLKSQLNACHAEACGDYANEFPSGAYSILRSDDKCHVMERPQK